jgi:hypothetical protein
VPLREMPAPVRGSLVPAAEIDALKGPTMQAMIDRELKRDLLKFNST